MPVILPPTRALTPKEQRFVREYLVDMDGANAARRTGYSPKNAKQAAYKLLQRQPVAVAIAAAAHAVADKLEITSERTFEELAKLAYAPVGKGQGTIDPKNKVAALSWLARLQGLLVQKHEHSGPDGKPIEVDVAALRQRISTKISALSKRTPAIEATAEPAEKAPWT